MNQKKLAKVNEKIKLAQKQKSLETQMVKELMSAASPDKSGTRLQLEKMRELNILALMKEQGTATRLDTSKLALSRQQLKFMDLN